MQTAETRELLICVKQLKGAGLGSKINISYIQSRLELANHTIASLLSAKTLASKSNNSKSLIDCTKLQSCTEKAKTLISAEDTFLELIVITYSRFSTSLSLN